MPERWTGTPGFRSVEPLSTEQIAGLVPSSRRTGVLVWIPSPVHLITSTRCCGVDEPRLSWCGVKSRWPALLQPRKRWCRILVLENLATLFADLWARGQGQSTQTAVWYGYYTPFLKGSNWGFFCFFCQQIPLSSIALGTRCSLMWFSKHHLRVVMLTAVTSRLILLLLIWDVVIPYYQVTSRHSRTLHNAEISVQVWYLSVLLPFVLLCCRISIRFLEKLLS